MKVITHLLLATLLITVLAGAAEGSNTSWGGTAGTLHLQDAGTVGRGKLIFSLGSSYSRTPDVWLTRDPPSMLLSSSWETAPVTYHTFLSRLVLTIGLSDYIEISSGLDIRNWIMQVSDEWEEGNFKTYTRGGIGDLDVSLKVCPPIPSDYFKLGFLGHINIPTGNKERRFTTDAVDFGVKGLFTVQFLEIEKFVPTKLHFNLGYFFNKNEEDGYGIIYWNHPDSSGFSPPAYPYSKQGESDSFNDMFNFGTAVEFLAGNTSLFVEFNWDKLYKADFNETVVDSSIYYGYRNQNTYTITPGITATSSAGVGVTLAADFNVNSENNKPITNPPDWKVYFALSFGKFIIPQDADDDGIEDKLDKCPDDPEDFDGYEDEDGCPDLDNDKDGIEDGVDDCPDLAEDFDGFEDGDGCPDLDNDGDGIPDVEDRCPNEPEDFDGFEDGDGCPDVLQDSEEDGVPDDLDRCPLQPEDIDGFQDEDGCPDLDNDLDGILDTDDSCPNEPETFNGYQDEDGCPDERPIEKKFIMRGIHFETGSAALTPDSYAILDQVVRSLMAYPEVRVEIRGYTDSVGSAEYNQGLSERRANSVREYLLNSGISPDRLVARGYGEMDPIASNKTPGGRSENRRIEFHRLN